MKNTKITNPSVDLLQSLFVENVRLFHRLSIVVEDIHGKKKITAGQRGILKSLESKGPLTVPEFARMRPVSRQHIQMLVNELLRKGMVKLIPNPAHKKSKLVTMTEKGRKIFNYMIKQEERVLRMLDLSIKEKDLKLTIKALRHIRESFESDRWGQLVQKGK